MFTLFKKKNLVTAVDKCQSLLKQQGFDTALSVNEYRFLTESSIFKEINSRFTSQGLSNYGGLSWCLTHRLERAIAHLEAGKAASDTMLILTDKLAGIALVIGNYIPQLKLTNNDMEAIARMTQASIKWTELSEYPSDEEMLNGGLTARCA